MSGGRTRTQAGVDFTVFLQNMAVAAQQVAILYIIVAVGFIADRLKLFTEDIARAATNLLFYFVTPSVIITSFLSMDYSPERAKALGIAFLGAVCTKLLGIVLSKPLFGKDAELTPVYRFGAVYGNMGYMALPMANAVLGEEGVFYCSAGVVAFNVVCFTHGISLMDKSKKDGKRFNLKRVILNPGVISVTLGLPLFLFGITLPKLVLQPLQYLAGMNTPLAMIFFGTYIANTDIKKMFLDKKIYLVALLKLIVMPLVMFGLYKLLGLSGVLLTACMISSSAPSANNTVMFAAKYGRDTGLASKVVALVSFISVFTMPVMIALASS